MTTHQSPNLEAFKLARYGDVNAKQIIKTIKGPVVLCYSGMSGTGTATAIQLALVANKFKHPIGMMYVRKDFDIKYDGKRSVEFHNVHHPKTTFIFVDDHIGGGRTFQRCQNALKKDLGDMVYGNYSGCLYDDDGKPGKMPPKKDWAPMITYACLRCYGLHELPYPGSLTGRKPLFQAAIQKFKWFKQLGGIA